MTEPTAQRFCPICSTETDQVNCPECAAPTLAAGFFEEDTGTIGTEGLIAGRYRPIKMLGEGAMGTVYLARHRSMDRKVAIKTLIGGLVDDRDAVRRFYREAQAASKLTHPNTVRIYDFGIDDVTGLPFFVMEYLQGRTLDEVAYEEGAMTERVACRRLSQVAKALVEAHEIGLIHRDLKPENIHVETLASDEHLRVLDFGLVTLARDAADGNGSLSGMTILGTPSYMSPEQVTREIALDARSDFYALGCVLHELLTDERPYDNENIMAIVQNQVNGPPLELPEVLPTGEAPSEGLRRLHGMLVAKDRNERPECTKMVASALVALGRGDGDAKVHAILDDQPLPVPMRQKSPAETVSDGDHLLPPAPAPAGLRITMAAFVLAAVAAVVMAFWTPLFGGGEAPVVDQVPEAAAQPGESTSNDETVRAAVAEAEPGPSHAVGASSAAPSAATAQTDRPTAEPSSRATEVVRVDADASSAAPMEVEANSGDDADVGAPSDAAASPELERDGAADTGGSTDGPADVESSGASSAAEGDRPNVEKSKPRKRPSARKKSPKKDPPKARPIPVW